MKTQDEVINYCNALYLSKALYIWRFNGEIITSQNIQDHYHEEYHSNPNSQYGSNYYTKKYQEAMARGGSVWGADCSGMLHPLSGIDNTAQGYYSSCTTKGVISNIDKSKVCLVFKSNGTTMHHVGVYCGNGYTIEMESSDTNCVKRELSKGTWTHFGEPNWIKYNDNNDIIKDTAIKGVDVSGYNDISDYSILKSMGVKFAVVKIINKQSNPDKLLKTHVNGFKTCGISCNDYYNYSYAMTTAKATQDAQCVINIYKEYIGEPTNNDTIWLDWENTGESAPLHKLGDKAVDIINTYGKIIIDAGLGFGIYTGMSFYNSYLKKYVSQINCDKWWIARYYKGNGITMNVSDIVNENYNPKNSTGLNIYAWQYTDALSIPNACTKTIDANIYYGNKNNAYIKPPTPTVVTTNNIENIVTANHLNVRALPNSLPTTKIVKVLNKDDKCDIKGYVNGWYQINDGWVSAKYIQTKQGRITADKLNIRTINNVNGNILGTFTNGDIVNLLSENNGWFLCELNNKFGWCSSKYIAVR